MSNFHLNPPPTPPLIPMDRDRLRRGNNKSLLSKRDLGRFDVLHISLTAPLDFIYQRIDARVDKRMEMGFLNEIKNLLKKYSFHHSLIFDHYKFRVYQQEDYRNIFCPDIPC